MVRIGRGHSDTIRSSGDAFEALNNRWPGQHGPSYAKAKQLCSMAIGGMSSEDSAREAFIEAAIEANLLG